MKQRIVGVVMMLIGIYGASWTVYQGNIWWVYPTVMTGASSVVIGLILVISSIDLDGGRR